MNVTITRIETTDYLGDEPGRGVRVHAKFAQPIGLPDRDGGFHAQATHVVVHWDGEWNATDAEVANAIENTPLYLSLAGYPLTASGARDKRVTTPTRVSATPTEDFDPETLETQIRVAVAQAYRNYLAARVTGVLA